MEAGSPCVAFASDEEGSSFPGPATNTRTLLPADVLLHLLRASRRIRDGARTDLHSDPTHRVPGETKRPAAARTDQTACPSPHDESVEPAMPE